MSFIHNPSLPDLHPYVDGIKSTWNVLRLCSLRSKTWLLHHDCHRSKMKKNAGIWHLFFFFCSGPRATVWINGHKMVFSSIWTLLIFFNWCFCSFKLWHPEERDYVIQSDRFPWVFFPLPLHSTFLPHFFVCSQSSVSLDCIWNYRSSYHSLKRLVCPALCILAVLSNP